MKSQLILTVCLLLGISATWPQVQSSSAVILPDVAIESFTAVPDCIFPDPRRGILSYRVSGGVTRVTISALHRGGRLRTFYSQSSRTPTPAIGATGVADSGAAGDIEGYRLVATGAGRDVSRELAFRYRIADFALVSPARHLRDTTGSRHTARYEADVQAIRVDSLTCSFRFDAPIRGESGRLGHAIVVSSSGRPVAHCEIDWRSAAKARAAGTVEWVARITDPCTQGRITRTARVNAIP